MSKIKFNRIQVVFKRDYDEYISWKSYKILLLMFLVLTAVAVVSINWLLPDQALITSDVSGTISCTIISNILFMLALIPLVISIPFFTSGTFTKEKANGIISSLLSTQLKPIEIWIGKSFAVFLPNFLVSILSPLVVSLVANNVMSISVSLLLSIFLITPLLFLGLTVLTIQLSMIYSSEMSIAPSYLIALILLAGVPLGSITNYLDITSWKFTFIYLIITVFMWGLVGGFSFFLSKERIILSK
ncbi:hypothetical protein [Bacillus atrophaeus]|uniref:hypothetical protein n=1 Tax=Bacillus atrophaeus TaxID=1452 RepID=UPI003CFAC89C